LLGSIIHVGFPKIMKSKQFTLKIWFSFLILELYLNVY